MEYRSKNPDLLFDDVMRYTIKEVTDFAVCYRNGNLPKEMERVTVFVTHRCNFLCGYCNGPHTNFNNLTKKKKMQMLNKNLSLEQFKKMLKDWKEHKCRHIHFSGGEPTLNKDLPEMVKLTTRARILSSITTNGSADTSVYRKLIDNGMTEIRISIDTSNQKDFDNIVEVRGYFNKVVQNIKEIVRMRDKEGKDVFLVLNACVGTINIKKIVEILKFLISLNPNDIKFLVIAMERRIISKQHNEKTIKELNKVLESFPKKRFLLLRNKIKKLFDANAIGLKDRKAQKVMKHCYLPLTERTIDMNYYYPCSIYVRGYGKPIGRITEPFKEQEKKSMKFVKYHNCRKDRICSRICTNCCKMFNISVNEIMDTMKIVKTNKIFSKKDIKNTKKKISNLIRAKPLSKSWFIIIKPSGYKYKNNIKEFLEKEKIRVYKEVDSDKWREIALPLYCYPLSNEEILFKLEMDEAFKKIEKGKINVLFIKGNIPEKRMQNIKNRLREIFPPQKYLLKTNRGKRMINLNSFHLPNKEDLIRENKILNNFIEIQSM